MSYMKHNAMVVTNWDENRLRVAHDKAKEIFRNIFKDDLLIKDATTCISPIVGCLANAQVSFMIAPDGSKEGWDTSDKADEARKEFQDWIIESHNLCDYIEVRWGGDTHRDAEITRSKEYDLNKEE